MTVPRTGRMLCYNKRTSVKRQVGGGRALASPDSESETRTDEETRGMSERGMPGETLQAPSEALRQAAAGHQIRSSQRGTVEVLEMWRDISRLSRRVSR